MTARRIVSAVSLVVGLFVASSASAQIRPAHTWTSDRPDAFAPAGVDGAYLLPAGEFMVSYSFMSRYMEGSLMGTDSVDLDDILEYWTVAPVDQKTHVHSVRVMYGITDDLSVEAVTQFRFHNIESWTATTTRGVYSFYETEAYGFDNVEATLYWSVFKEGPYRAHLHAGISVPFLGGIDDYDDNAIYGRKVYSPYTAQIGSGTFDPLPGFTFQVQNEMGSFGLQGKGRIHIGENAEGWARGNRWMGTAWAAYRFSDYISASGRVVAETWGDIEGSDDRLDWEFSPAANPYSIGGTIVDLPLGINLHMPDGVLAGYRFAVEGWIPLYQDLNGPQLAHDWSVQAAIHKIF